MDANKKAKLEQNGWKVGDTAEFLQLAPEESALVEIRLALSRQLKSRRSAKMTQAELAQKIGSSQPRVAMAERGSRAVSLDLMVRALVATGATSQDIARAIAGR
ncbi:MAG TPA: helix-turn-helix transcriptional regulator [Thermoflexales bacterium]|nr:helix-turn-helix transcriptional regulator [Thermoflexales bacterium]HQW36685.1 helix-turn-helix transcriptional regulator [Thermoflexales bacterium]HQZ23301.1 helix-turn-helix transcriptional regulator [Thermoflexales bacterium]HRA00285.1 helix-turn-helix transcriptional regulator [Thermoflexales bacterium]